MRILATGFALCCLALVGFGADEEEGNEYSPDQGLVVHEWGVVRVNVNGQAHAPENIPDFVHRRPRIMNKSREKPLVFFYNGEAVDIDVSLTAQNCTFFCWYPDPFQKDEAQKADLGERDQRLHWRGVKISPARGSAGQGEKMDASHWWAACRKTDANVFKAGGEEEKFLFYETNDNGGWKVTARVEGGKVLARNSGKFSARDLIFRAGEKTYWLAELDVKAEQEMKEVNAGMADKLRATLAAAGLFAKEIDAFMATWEKDLCGAKTARLLYRLPQETWESMVAMSIQPEPKSVKRVMIIAQEVRE